MSLISQVCNNLGHCYCEYGYGGVDCGLPGLGGSVDGGPAPASSNDAASPGPISAPFVISAHFNTTAALSILILIILPLAAFVWLVKYRRRDVDKYFPCMTK